MSSNSIKYACGVEYIGTHYKGWQSQDNQDTIQDSIEDALSQVANKKTRIHSAGRTDTGVHACGQIFHFLSDAKRNEKQWIDGMNSNLTKDISIQWVKTVNDDFDARRSAIHRTYIYLVNNQAFDVFYHERSLYVRQKLDLTSMIEASKYLIGRHDFSSFRASSCQSKNPVREMMEIEIKSNRLISIEFRANAFLHHMIRNIIGTLLEVGIGSINPLEMKHILEARDRTKAYKTSPSSGLYLVNIEYPKKYQLPCRSFEII